jgi:hypothetical protein
MKLHLFLILAFLLFTNNVIADSPLTSIEFWKVSEDSYVLKIGKERGKKKLDNVIFKFLTDSNTTIFDKIALVNAMGWDSNSKFKNSEIFLNKLKKEHLNYIKKYRKQLLKAPPFSWDNLEFDDNGDILRNDKNDKHFIQGIFYESVDDFDKKYDAVESLWTPEDIIRSHSDYKGFGVEDNYTVYLYLLAMDNYWDASLVFDVLDNFIDDEGNVISVTYNNSDSKEAFDFIKMLVSTQSLFLTKEIDCEVWEEFNKIRGRDYYSCMSNLSIRKSLLKSYDYLKIYSDNCEEVKYDINTTYCFRNVIHATQNQQVTILHYPLFIYGELTIYDQNDSEVFKFIIDGGDSVGLDISNYPLGSYRIQMINTQTEPKTPYNLDLIIY